MNQVTKYYSVIFYLFIVVIISTSIKCFFPYNFVLYFLSFSFGLCFYPKLLTIETPDQPYQPCQ